MIDNLTAKRKAAGLSLEALAAELGVTSMTVYRWERGKARPHRLMVKEIERALAKAERRKGKAQ